MNKFFSVCSLARKANFVRYGSEFCMQWVKKGGQGLIVIACDISEKQKGNIIYLCEQNKATYIVTKSSKEELGHIIGAKPVGAFCICDQGLAKTALRYYKELNDGGMIYEYNS